MPGAERRWPGRELASGLLWLAARYVRAELPVMTRSISMPSTHHAALGLADGPHVVPANVPGQQLA